MSGTGPGRLIRGAGLAGVVLLAAACMHPLADAPDVRTPNEVVREMLRLAGVTRNDVVYDLGSGDGRIVIEAAKEHGARGVGIEIDPRLLAASERYARRARVSDRVRFLQQDLFQSDLREATVVTMYLGNELNVRLRPKLLSELRPGSRIVSHDFSMGDWPPTRSLRVESSEREHTIHLWVVPSPGAGPR
jgi:SAM-dependent methyltransferase